MGTVATMLSLAAAGMAGVTVGGALWGFLGVAALLFCVGWICHLFEYDYRTVEMERCYNSPVTLPALSRMTTRSAVLERTRSFVLTPLGELESFPQ